MNNETRTDQQNTLPDQETTTPPPDALMIDAVYQDGVIKPEQPLDLPPGTPLRVHIVPPAPESEAVPDSVPDTGTEQDEPTEPPAPQETTDEDETQPAAEAAQPAPEPASSRRTAALMLSMPVAIGAQAAIAQGMIFAGVLVYLVAAALAVSGLWEQRRPAADTLPPDSHEPALDRWLMAAALLAGVGTFILSSGNRYRLSGVLLWLVSMVIWWLACTGGWQPQAWRASIARIREKVHPGRLLSNKTLLLLVAVLLVGAVFRFANLVENPLDMNSDQAEKLLDVRDVLNGTTYIFFERNTGREPWQFYWTALLIKLTPLELGFPALKVGTSLIGWLMLPAIFLLARELFGTRTALLAALFAAVASWGVITARYGLRYPLAPCAVAWTLYFLVRGLKRNERISLLAAGVWVGIGMQGYTAYRFMALLVPLLVLAWLAWLYWQRKTDLILPTLRNSILAMVMAVLVTMPLIRYTVEYPEEVLYRSATRLSGMEQAIEGNPLEIFLDNVKNVLLMFNYTSDEVWVANLPGQPAMDSILGALLVIGTVGMVVLSVRRRDPWPALILATGVLLLMPSALSIAFPRENPSVVRTGGAMPALLIVCAVVPGMLLTMARTQRRLLLRAAGVLVVGFVVGVVVPINANRVFAQYPEQYCPRAQNAYDIAQAMKAFLAEEGHTREHAWIVGYPHWVDSRAVGVWIDDITFPNTVMGAEEVAQVELNGEPGWFVLNTDDNPSRQALRQKYPRGTETIYRSSQCPDESARQFVVFETQP